jgi:superfamily II RNA helicase
MASAFLHIPSNTTVPNLPDDPAIVYSFPLDIWQSHAVAAIHAGHNVLVTAKTGSGKTLVGEYQIAYSLKQGKRVFYTTPIKSLSNQKYHDLKHLFPSYSVGIMTGDMKSNPEADIVVMTTEILRNLLFKQSTPTASIGIAGQISLSNVGAVVFDEVHYINDPDRGHVWEETLILLPTDVQLILLSATIDSPDEFASWLGEVKRRPITLLKTTHRIVPLIHGVFDASTPKDHLPLRPLKMGDEEPYDGAVYTQWLKERASRAKAADNWAAKVGTAKAAGDSVAGSKDKVKLQSFTHTLNQCVQELQERDLMPALFFVMSRKDCERYASQVAGSLISSTDTANIQHIMKFHLHPYQETIQHLPQYHQLTALLERGIAFHHSGVLPLLKEIVELLFARGLIKVLFCTETFAVGLNMPARTVVFLDMKKPANEGGGFRPFRADEYIQMAGRAGRRGKDSRGIVIYLPARQPVEPDELRSVFCGGLQPLESRLQFHYDFILKAIYNTQFGGAAASGGGHLWETLMNESFWNAQRKSAACISERQLVDKEAALSYITLSETQRAELEHRDKLKQDLKILTNSAKRKVATELEQWTARHAGPQWSAAAEAYEQYKRIYTECRKLRSVLDELTSHDHSARITPLLGALHEWGALGSSEHETPTLSRFGILATEVNEANPLLVARLYESQILKDVSAHLIVAVLASTIVDNESLDKTVHPYDLPPSIPLQVKHTLVTMDEWGQKGAHFDAKYNINSPEYFWSLSTFWVQIAYDWVVHKKSAAEITSTYGIYEGNLMRGLHKLSAVVNEWICMATYLADVDMLEKMKNIPEQILRDIAVPESLYLRL